MLHLHILSFIQQRFEEGRFSVEFSVLVLYSSCSGCHSLTIFVPTPVPNAEGSGSNLSLTLFSPFSWSDSFLQPFINILALVVQKMGQVR